MKDNNICNIVFVGESGVGKTSIINTLLKEKFTHNHITTIGIGNNLTQVKVNNQILDVNFIDTAGQEKYRSVTKLFYAKKDIIILVYDVTNLDSYNAIKTHWVKEVKDNAKNLKGKKNNIYYIFYIYF